MNKGSMLPPSPLLCLIGIIALADICCTISAKLDKNDSAWTATLVLFAISIGFVLSTDISSSQFDAAALRLTSNELSTKECIPLISQMIRTRNNAHRSTTSICALCLATGFVSAFYLLTAELSTETTHLFSKYAGISILVAAFRWSSLGDHVMAIVSFVCVLFPLSYALTRDTVHACDRAHWIRKTQSQTSDRPSTSEGGVALRRFSDLDSSVKWIVASAEEVAERGLGCTVVSAEGVEWQLSADRPRELICLMCCLSLSLLMLLRAWPSIQSASSSPPVIKENVLRTTAIIAKLDGTIHNHAKASRRLLLSQEKLI